ncbi:MAG: HAD-IA family hydrolase [Pseudomonadota bacterium]
MTAPHRLILFDVDGTLVDSQAAIVQAMHAAFDAIRHPVPERPVLLSVIGLSLDRAMQHLTPDLGSSDHARMAEVYKTTFSANRTELGAAHAPLYPGARNMLDQLAGMSGHVLGVATGKSQRGLDALIEAHGLGDHFITRQVADHHPSKPHPSMIQTAMDETGADPRDTVMIGDTSFDMEMARAAGVTGIGVSWGYHSAEALGVDHVLSTFDDLPEVLQAVWERSA